MQKTNFPVHPQRSGDPSSSIWSVWQMLEYLANSVVDPFINKFVQGSVSVAAAATTVVVSHGLGVLNYTAKVVPLADPGGRWWISGKTSSQFTINLQVAAPVGGIPFDYEVKAV